MLFAPLKIVREVGFGDIFEIVEEMEISRIFRFDLHDIISIIRFKLKDPNMNPLKIVGISSIEFIQILKEDKTRGEYLALAKNHSTTGFDQILKDFDFILDFPIYFDQEGVKIPFISTQKVLKGLLERVRQMVGNEFKILNISSIKPDVENFKALLTKKQREIISYATNNGYFEIPREISSKEIADHFNIAISVVNEHIRKIEKRFFHYIFLEKITQKQ